VTEEVYARYSAYQGVAATFSGHVTEAEGDGAFFNKCDEGWSTGTWHCLLK